MTDAPSSRSADSPSRSTADTVLHDIDLRSAAGHHHRRRRIVGLRQDHAAAAHRRIRDTRCRNDHHRRTTGGEPGKCCGTAPSERRLRRPGRRPVPASDRRTEHRLRPARYRPHARCAPASAELLETVSLDASYASRRPHQLSGGQQQRVALARALARQPVLMLLDEPFSALDTGLRASTRKAVARLLADAGVTTLLVTHDQEEALSIADQVAVMRDGRFTQVGTPQHVYRAPHRPVHRRVPRRLHLAAVHRRLRDRRLRARPHTRAGMPPTDPRRLSLRPEQLVATVVSDSERLNGVGTVIATEFLGHDVLLTIDPAGDAAPIIVRQHSLNPPADRRQGAHRGGGHRGRARDEPAHRPSARPRRPRGGADRNRSS